MRQDSDIPASRPPRRLLAMVWVLLGLWMGAQWLAEQHWHAADDPVEFSCELCHLGHSPAMPATVPLELPASPPPARLSAATANAGTSLNWSAFSIRAPPHA